MAALEAEESIETQYVEAIAPDGTTTTKRIRPRWYWRERNKIKSQRDPNWRSKERERSRLKRLRARAARESLGQPQARSVAVDPAVCTGQEGPTRV
jgi:hypothetical protein